jgi:hypothetical protein
MVSKSKLPSCRLTASWTRKENGLNTDGRGPTIAVLRTPLQLASEWKCRGLHLSRG